MKDWHLYFLISQMWFITGWFVDGYQFIFTLFLAIIFGGFAILIQHFEHKVDYHKRKKDFLRDQLIIEVVEGLIKKPKKKK